MKLNQVKVKVISGGDAATLEAAVLSFLQGGGERTFLGVQFAANGSDLAALITYTE